MRNRFQTLHVVLHVLGSLLTVLGFVILSPLVVAFFSGELSPGCRILLAFLLPSLLALCAGQVFRKMFRAQNPTNLQALLICSLGWTAFSAVGAIPFVIGVGASYLDGICQTFTALSTGGFSPHDASIGYYRLAGYPRYVLIEYILYCGNDPGRHKLPYPLQGDQGRLGGRRR